MKIWLRILGGAYIVVGGLNSLVFLFILGVYGRKWGIEAIRVEEYVAVIGHPGGWILYVLLGFSGASCRPPDFVGLVREARNASICGQSFYPSIRDDYRIVNAPHSAFPARPSVSASCSLETAEFQAEHKRRVVIL